jgi:NAD-dependent DNA ligase
MKQYALKSLLPAWHFDPATNRQLKLLRFFGKDISQPLTKGVCSGIIGRLFSNPANKYLWTAYVFATGDEDDTSTNLQPHSHEALLKVVIPKDWRPKQLGIGGSSSRGSLEKLIAETLKEGSPFDDPLPEIHMKGRNFCFTGDFEFGPRKQCQEATTSRGGLVSREVTRSTDVLVVAKDANPRWSHGSYGNKIEKALILKLQHGKPIIIPELYWRTLLDSPS